MAATVILKKPIPNGTKSAAATSLAASVREAKAAIAPAMASNAPARVIVAPPKVASAAVVAQATSAPVPSSTSAAVQAQVEINAQARGYESSAAELRAEQEARRLAEIRERQAEAAAMNAAQLAAEPPRAGIVTQGEAFPEGATPQQVNPNYHYPTSGPLYDEVAAKCAGWDDTIKQRWVVIDGVRQQVTNYQACMIANFEKIRIASEASTRDEAPARAAPPPAPPASKPNLWWIVSFLLFGF